MKNYEYKENEITINEKTTKFPDTIEEVIENDNYIFVRLAVRLNGDDTTNDEISNVYVLKKNGEIAWQIKNIPPKNNPHFSNAPVVDISLREKQLFIVDFMGRILKVNVDTGELESVVGFTK